MQVIFPHAAICLALWIEVVAGEYQRQNSQAAAAAATWAALGQVSQLLHHLSCQKSTMSA